MANLKGSFCIAEVHCCWGFPLSVRLWKKRCAKYLWICHLSYNYLSYNYLSYNYLSYTSFVLYKSFFYTSFVIQRGDTIICYPLHLCYSSVVLQSFVVQIISHLSYNYLSYTSFVLQIIFLHITCHTESR